MRPVTLLYFLVLTQIIGSGCHAGCLVSSKSPRQPVYVANNTGRYEIIIPSANGIRLQQGEQIILLCSGHLNRLNQTNTNVSVATCINRERFLVSNQIYTFSNLECRRAVRASIVHTESVCANGVVSNIGFHIEDQFLQLIEVCFDSDLGCVIYTRHLLLSPELKKFNGSYHKPTFNTKGLSPDNKSVSLVYHGEAQKVRLSSLLQSSILASEYVTNRTHLAKGHLTPEEDFPLVTWRYATFFFLNACPQWTSIDEGNWYLVESMVRTLRNSLEENLLIVTGTYEVLELKDRSGNPKPLYLSQRGRKFPVPKYIWKLVYAEKLKKAVVLVVFNNPYEPVGKYLCSSVCNTHGWYSERWSSMRRGFVQCCSFVQFKQIVRGVPALAVTGILEGPE